MGDERKTHCGVLTELIIENVENRHNFYQNRSNIGHFTNKLSFDTIVSWKTQVNFRRLICAVKGGTYVVCIMLSFGYLTLHFKDNWHFYRILSCKKVLSFWITILISLTNVQPGVIKTHVFRRRQYRHCATLPAHHRFCTDFHQTLNSGISRTVIDVNTTQNGLSLSVSFFNLWMKPGLF